MPFLGAVPWLDVQVRLQLARGFVTVRDADAAQELLDGALDLLARVPGLGALSAEAEELQREVIAALERERPPLAILPHGEWTDTFDGIANAVRTPLVADYVYANYRVVEVAAGRLVAWRPPSSP